MKWKSGLSALAAVQPPDQPVEREEEQALAEQQGGEEGADLERRVERPRLAEAAAEQRIFALGERQLDEQGDEDRRGQGEPRRATPSDRRARRAAAARRARPTWPPP